MYIPDKFKLNKFTPVAIPSNQQLFQRFGFTSTPSNGSYSGEAKADFDSSKINAIAKGDKLNESYMKSEKDSE